MIKAPSANSLLRSRFPGDAIGSDSAIDPSISRATDQLDGVSPLNSAAADIVHGRALNADPLLISPSGSPVTAAPVVGAPTLSINDTPDHVINAIESTSVAFSVSGVPTGATGQVTFTNSANHQDVVSIAGNGTYSANLSTLLDGTISSSLSATSSSGSSTTISGNSVSLDTDRDLNPTVSVNAINPSHVTFTISGLEGDETGTITFTDSHNQQDVVPVGSNGNYVADLSNLTNGTVTYLLSVTDPAGNVTSVDPPINLGDGSANAPGGVPQLPTLLNGYASRPLWNVAGVDYAVGVNAGTVLKIPSAANLPQGATLYNGAIYVDGNNVTLNGYNLSGLTVMINADATGTVTISNCASSTTGIIRSTTDATANLVVEYCTLDGGGPAASTDFATIQTWCPTTVEYCFIGNSGQGIHVSGADFTAQYNVLEGFAFSAAQHANAIYISGSNDPSVSTTIAYNTIYSEVTSGPPNGPIGIGAAIAFFDDGGSFYNSQVSNNTVISASSHAASYLIGYYVTSPSFATGGTVSDNFLASVNGWGGPNSGAFGAFYNGSPGLVQATVTNNIDMANGNVITGTNSEVPGTSSGVPSILLFSTDSGTVGDGVTNDNTLTLTGTAVANSTVKVFDGATLLGTAMAGSNGAWSYTTGTLANGSHSFTATDTVAGTTSAASTALSVTVDTVAPVKPVIGSNSVSASNIVTLNGTAEANSKVTVFDGTTQLGTATANASGAWNFVTASLVSGNHSLTATDTDAAGNTSAVSALVNLTLSAPVVAANLVVNGSFETGNFTGWTLGGNDTGSIYINSQSQSGQGAAASTTWGFGRRTLGWTI